MNQIIKSQQWHCVFFLYKETKHILSPEVQCPGLRGRIDYTQTTAYQVSPAASLNRAVPNQLFKKMVLLVRCRNPNGK